MFSGFAKVAKMPEYIEKCTYEYI